MRAGGAHQIAADAAFAPIFQHVQRLDLAICQWFGEAAPAADGGETHDPGAAAGGNVLTAGGRDDHTARGANGADVVGGVAGHRQLRKIIGGQDIRVGRPPDRDVHRRDRDGVRRPSRTDLDHGARSRTAAKKPSVP